MADDGLALPLRPLVLPVLAGLPEFHAAVQTQPADPSQEQLSEPEHAKATLVYSVQQSGKGLVDNHDGARTDCETAGAAENTCG